MRVIVLGLLYGAAYGGGLAALFGAGLALAGPRVGLPLPHNLAGETTLGVVWKTAQVGLVAGSVGGVLLGLLVSVGAAGREAVGRRIGAVVAVLPLLWLPYFATRGLLRRGTPSLSDLAFFGILVVLPLVLAAVAGRAMGGRLARVAGSNRVSEPVMLRVPQE